MAFDVEEDEGGGFFDALVFFSILDASAIGTQKCNLLDENAAQTEMDRRQGSQN
jgi:hypothetical protein